MHPTAARDLHNYIQSHIHYLQSNIQFEHGNIQKYRQIYKTIYKNYWFGTHFFHDLNTFFDDICTILHTIRGVPLIRPFLEITPIRIFQKQPNASIIDAFGCYGIALVNVMDEYSDIRPTSFRNVCGSCL